MENSSNPIYSRPVLDFVTVAAEFCKYLEQCRGTEQAEFVDVIRKLIPMLYLKASMVTASRECDGYVEHPVTEDDYDYVRQSVADIMGTFDDYLDVFVADFKYSDTPIRRQISEDLADAYQALRNFVEVFRQGYDEAMQVALAEVLEQFETAWGQNVLNALRALHDVKFGAQTEEV
ncbi:MAG TPA: DUF5063 domain-containing protein [Candidatus Caccomonas pullistercoris]|nr:DUF5063 domain-containing protein [Candidatus Caccomonas pullistercoris]